MCPSQLIVETDDNFGPYATCNVCVNGRSPLNKSHTCTGHEYVCDCESGGFPPHYVPCGANVGKQNESHFLGASGVGGLCERVRGPGQVAVCAVGTAADKLQGFWYSTLASGRGSTWRVVDVIKRVHRKCHADSFYSAVESRAPKCFKACGEPRNTSSLCWAGCFLDTALGKQARSSTSGVHDGMSRTELMAAWSRPFESSIPAEGGCPDVPCTLWRTFVQSGHQYCDEPDAGTPWAVDLTAAFGPSCAGAPANTCCYAPLGYNGGPPFGTPCSSVCAAMQRSGNDTSYCGKSDHSSYGERAAGQIRLHAHELALL